MRWPDLPNNRNNCWTIKVKLSPSGISHVTPSLVAQDVMNPKSLPAKQKTQVQSLGEDDPLEKEMANHSSILVWEIPWTEEPGGLQFMKSQESQLATKSLPPCDFLENNISFSNL